jgi:hypothetical protein
LWLYVERDHFLTFAIGIPAVRILARLGTQGSTDHDSSIPNAIVLGKGAERRAEML